MSCPCCSTLPYQDCCEPYHQGLEPPTALSLMRSRYSAYAKGLTQYIQKTTHPKSPHLEKNRKRWTKGIEEFSRTTRFNRLEIVGFGENWVHFIAHLTQGDKSVLLEEKSLFEKVDGRWRYLVGEVTIQ